jgi:superfamily II DNA/RNA helicase
MMDRLATPYGVDKNGALDACLATNIIEVGVDIDRLSLMSVVGQPKGSASYIQVTGRVGRRWDERPGLIVTIYNPSRSRDRSHYEQFHAYHRRLYERVEPTSVTPFAGAALERAAAGAMLAWVRQNSAADVNVHTEHCNRVNDAAEILKRRCLSIEHGAERDRALAFLDSIRDDLVRKWRDGIYNDWESYPQNPDHHYVMLWPGKYSTAAQRRRGSTVPSSMRHVDREAELAVGEEMA